MCHTFDFTLVLFSLFKLWNNSLIPFPLGRNRISQTRLQNGIICHLFHGIRGHVFDSRWIFWIKAKKLFSNLFHPFSLNFNNNSNIFRICFVSSFERKFFSFTSFAFIFQFSLHLMQFQEFVWIFFSQNLLRKNAFKMKGTETVWNLFLTFHNRIEIK